MQEWKKLGRIWAPDKTLWWQQQYAQLPTVLPSANPDVIRVYVGSTDAGNNARPGYLELDANDPIKVLNVTKEPVAELGAPGAFDDSGLVPSSFIVEDDHIKMYTVGYQRTEKRPYMLLPGLLISKDGGETFERYSEAPIIPRQKRAPWSLAAPFALKDESAPKDTRYKMWLWVARKWVKIEGKAYLSAYLGFASSADGIDWRLQDKPAIDIKAGEFSLGRPSVHHLANGTWEMYYSVRWVDKLYRLGYATSEDGINWTRRDDELQGLDVSPEGWDSEMVCYPAVIRVNNRTFMFHNGNSNGKTGFGVAEMIETH